MLEGVDRFNWVALFEDVELALAEGLLARDLVPIHDLEVEPDLGVVGHVEVGSIGHAFGRQQGVGAGLPPEWHFHAALGALATGGLVGVDQVERGKIIIKSPGATLRGARHDIGTELVPVP